MWVIANTRKCLVSLRFASFPGDLHRPDAQRTHVRHGAEIFLGVERFGCLEIHAKPLGHGFI